MTDTKTLNDPFTTEKESTDLPEGMVKLGDIAGDALEGFGGEDEQLAALPACRVKFAGMAWDSLDEVPALKQEMSFQVRGVCVGHTQEVMANGELRELAKVKVTEVIKI